MKSLDKSLADYADYTDYLHIYLRNPVSVSEQNRCGRKVVKEYFCVFCEICEKKRKCERKRKKVLLLQKI